MTPLPDAAIAPLSSTPGYSHALPASTDALATLIALLRRPKGARLEELMIATGWDARWVMSAVWGALRKERRLAVVSEVEPSGGRTYRILPRPRRQSLRDHLGIEPGP